jgi:hypothetical protein
MDDINKSIQEKHAERKLNILKGFSDLDETFEKAVYADNAQNRKLQRVGKTYGGKKEEDAPKDDKKPKEDDTSGGKSPADHAKETSTEHLQKFLDTQKRNTDHDDDTKEAIAAAESELKSRGEKDAEGKADDGKADDGKKEKSLSNNSKEVKKVFEEMTGDSRFASKIESLLEKEFGDEYSEKYGSTDFADIFEAIGEDKYDNFIKKELKKISKEKLLKILNKDSFDSKKDVEGKADDSKKGFDGFTSAQDEYIEGDISKKEYIKRVKEQYPKHKDFISDFVKKHNGIGIGGNSEMGALDDDDAREELENIVSEVYGKEIDGYDFIPEEEEDEIDPIEAEEASKDVLAAAEESWGAGVADDKVIHADDLSDIINNYDIVYQGVALPRGSEKKLRAILEKVGWKFEE